jgi:tripartite-type tricarboxylate transporter receptor subunit TctC
MFDPIVSSLGYIKGGQLRALGVTGATRVPALPDVPTVSETVPGFDVTGAIGIGAPRGTPVEVTGYLNDKVNAALADPAIKARLNDLGFVPTPMSAAEFGTFMAAQTEQWAKVIQAANIKPEQ